MRAKSLTRLIIVALIASMLGGAYLIVARDNTSANGSKQEAPSGFFH
jgi:hypothetical protein